MRVQGQELEAGKLEEEKAAGELSVEKMCRVAVVSRAGYYRSFAERSPDEEEMMLRSRIQKYQILAQERTWASQVPSLRTGLQKLMRK